MRWRSLAFFLGGSVLGTGLGLALGFLLCPFVFPPPPASEQLTEADRRGRVVAEGRFIHANTSDPLHWGKGAITVRGDSVFLGEDFEVGPGPKYHVYLVPKAQVRTSAEVSGQSFIDLGRELCPEVGDGGNREGGISWGCLTPPLLHQRSDMPCPTITSSS